MKCSHPQCTGIHDNNRYRELCPRSIEGKRARDRRYSMTAKGMIARMRGHAIERVTTPETIRLMWATIIIKGSEDNENR